MKIFFVLWQVVTAIAAAAALLLLLMIIFLRSTAQFAREGAGVLAYVAQLFTSGFTKGTAPKEPAGWVVSLPQAALALLFIAMLVTVFLPGAKNLLHLVAALAGVTAIWYAWLMLSGPRLEIFCLPLLVVWFVYYLLCVFWRASQVVLPQ